MAYSVEEQAALDRLALYNAQTYNASTNPYGLAGEGYRANPDTGFEGNFTRAVNDLVLAGEAMQRETSLGGAAQVDLAEAQVALAVAARVAAEIAETNAEDALSDLLSAVVNGLFTTSATSVAIGTGSKTFTAADDLSNDVPMQVGMWVKIVSRANTANWMSGTVTAVANSNPDTLTVNVTTISGSGTLSDWNVIITGQPGDIGPVAKTDYSALPTLAAADSLIFFDASDSYTPKEGALSLLTDYIADEVLALSLALGG